MLQKRALVLGLSVLSSLAVFGQSAVLAASPSVRQTHVPLQSLYVEFLRHQLRLDQKAVELQQHGKPHEAAYYLQAEQKSLHFNDQQMAILRKAALQVQQETAEAWASARPIMDQDREWLKLNGRFAGHPPGHAQVHQLQKAMEAAILQTITNVNRKLGPLAAAQLRTYLRNEIAPHLTIQKLSPETQHDPHLESHEALGGYALEVQR